MRALRGVARFAGRHRYLTLALWAVPWFVAASAYRDGGVTDWIWFEYGARTFIHLGPGYSDGLQLYARHSNIQIGPPPLALLAAFQWLPPAVVGQLFAILMAAAGLACVKFVESAATAGVDAVRRRQVCRLVTAGAVVVIPLWTWEAAQWRHLDDVLAVTATLAATALIARRRPWWLAAALVGIGVASKPWALVVTPVLMGLPRVRRAPATVVMVAAAGACWAPFVLAARGTVSALGAYRLPVGSATTLHLLGVTAGSTAPGWVRPVQLVGGVAISLVVAARGRWTAVPLVGFGFRVVTDPQSYLYYGLGPLLGGLLWDARSGRRVPVMTMAVAVVEFVMPALLPLPDAACRLAGLLVVLWFSTRRPARGDARTPSSPAPLDSPRLVTA